nr:MAG TPA: hypothetical protein [Caudoviricetes sp.]
MRASSLLYHRCAAMSIGNIAQRLIIIFVQYAVVQCDEFWEMN